MAKSKDRKKEAKAGKTSAAAPKKGETKKEAEIGKKTKSGKAITEPGKSNVAIGKCFPCKPSYASTFQDQKYGVGRRVFVVNADRTESFCSVCSSSKKKAS